MKQLNVTSNSIINGKLKTICAAAHSPNRPLGENRSPELSWDDVPGAAYFLALIVDESAHNWLHMFTAGAWTTHLAEGALDERAYVGPYPPAGTGEHAYTVYVYALSRDPSGIRPSMDAPCDFRCLETRIEGCGIFARGSLVGQFGHGDRT